MKGVTEELCWDWDEIQLMLGNMKCDDILRLCAKGMTSDENSWISAEQSAFLEVSIMY